MVEQAHFGGQPCRNEFSGQARGFGRKGADDLHRSALRDQVLEQFPAGSGKARCERQGTGSYPYRIGADGDQTHDLMRTIQNQEISATFRYHSSYWYY